MLGACSNGLDEAQREAAVARSELDAGNIAGARVAIARALAHRDDQVDILLLDARIKYLSQELRAAFDAYRTVLAFDPNNLEALSAVSQLGVRANERDIARDAIRRALAIDPGNPEVLLSQGILLIEEKKYDRAIASAEQLLAAHPQDPRGTVLKSRSLFLLGRAAESMALLKASAETHGNNQWIAAALLENARAAGDVPLMLEQFALLGEANPASVDLALDEINTLYKSGRQEAARSMGAAFIDRFGEDVEKMNGLVDLWAEYDASPLAPGLVEDLALSERAAARLATARFYLDRGDASTARRLIEHAPDRRYMGLVARLHVRRGAPTGRDLARQILADDTTNCDALAALTEWHLAHRAPGDAVVTAQVLATQCTDRIEGYRQQALAYDRLGRAAAVERVYREGIEAHPQDRILTGELARWLLARGRTDAAVSAVRRLSKVAPSRTSTWRLYQAVCREARNAGCAAVAAAGLRKAKAQYALDPLPGVRPSDQLFGRSWV
ncbi:tetratricopeptide repeat protein [Tsuneonella sp. HG249]